MFSATEPLASSPLATSGAGIKSVQGSATLRARAQTLSGSSQYVRVIEGSGDLAQSFQRVLGFALYTRKITGSAALEAPAHIVEAICYAVTLKTGTASLLQAAQIIEGYGTVTKTVVASSALVSPVQQLNGAGTLIRILYGEGALQQAPQTVYGSELWPIVIRTPNPPLNLYEATRHITSEPYSTTNHYLTLYQVPGFTQVFSTGEETPRTVTAIITAASAVTSSATPQPIDLIIVTVDGLVVYPVMPGFEVLPGEVNMIPLRDFNLVTGDVIQVKATGTGSATVTLSLLLNTQTYYEVL